MMEFLTSHKGKPVIFYDGYRYAKSRDNKCGSSVWYCTNNKCAAKLTITENKVVAENRHVCGKKIFVEIERALERMRKRAREEKEISPYQIYEEELKAMQKSSPELVAKMPRYVSLKSSLYRYRMKVSKAKNSDPENITFQDSKETKNEISNNVTISLSPKENSCQEDTPALPEQFYQSEDDQPDEVQAHSVCKSTSPLNRDDVNTTCKEPVFPSLTPILPEFNSHSSFREEPEVTPSTPILPDFNSYSSFRNDDFVANSDRIEPCRDPVKMTFNECTSNITLNNGKSLEDLIEENLKLFSQYLVFLLRQIPVHKSYALQQKFINEAIETKLICDKENFMVKERKRKIGKTTTESMPASKKDRKNTNKKRATQSKRNNQTQSDSESNEKGSELTIEDGTELQEIKRELEHSEIVYCEIIPSDNIKTENFGTCIENPLNEDEAVLLTEQNSLHGSPEASFTKQLQDYQLQPCPFCDDSFPVTKIKDHFTNKHPGVVPVKNTAINNSNFKEKTQRSSISRNEMSSPVASTDPLAKMTEQIENIPKIIL